MPTYTGTDSVSQWSPETPAGNNAPSELDDALREIKRVMTAVVQKALTAKGGVRMATVMQASNLAMGSGGVANTWQRRPLGTINDPTSLIVGGTYTNSFKPIAGVYQVDWFAVGWRIDLFQSKICVATSNSTTANTDIGLFGSIGHSPSAANDGTAESRGAGILTADGLTSYGLAQIEALVNTTDGWGRVAPAGWAGTTHIGACVTLRYLGASPLT